MSPGNNIAELKVGIPQGMVSFSRLCMIYNSDSSKGIASLSKACSPDGNRNGEKIADFSFQKRSS